MGTFAKTAGSRTRDNTRRLRRTAVWFAALWPASLHPGFGETWRTHSRHGRRRLRWRATFGLALCLANLPATMTPDRWGRTCRVRPFALLPWWPLRRGAGVKQAARRPAGYRAHGWRRHLMEGALAASIVMMIGALLAFTMIHPGEAGTPQGHEGQSYAPHGATGDRHGVSLNAGRHSSAHGGVSAQGQDGHGGSATSTHDLDTTLVSDIGDSGSGEPHGRRDLPWESPTFNPTLTHFSGGGGGGMGGGGGGGGGGGNPGDSSSQDTGPSQGEPGGTDPQTDPASPFPPASPDQPTRPPVVDPDPDYHPQPTIYTPPASPIVSAVPEPHAWLMMILGFSVVGGALRQRRRSETSSPPQCNL